MKKKIIVITAAVMALILLAAFTDVPKTHWAYSELEKAQKSGLVTGVGNDRFEPDSRISVQEVATLLYRAYGKYGSATDFKTDYSSECALQLQAAGVSDWAKTYVAYGLKHNFWTENELKAGGVASTGTPGRGLVAQWIYRTLPGKNDFALRILPYEDNSDIDPAYYEAVDVLWKYGMMRGASGSFYPKDGISRVEAAVIGARVIDKLGAQYPAYSLEPFVYESGVMSNFDAKYRRFHIDSKLFNIAGYAKILLDGESVSFEALSKLNGRKITVSQYLGASNTGSLIIQTAPAVMSGRIEKLAYCDLGPFASDPHDIVSINAGGVVVDYVRDKNTDVLRSMRVGNTVEFIADGIYLLEIK